MRQVLTALVILSLSAMSFADAPTIQRVKFKNSEANDAVTAHDTAEAKARAEYNKAIVAAKTKLIDSLTIVLTKTTKSGDLDEAVKLRDKIAALKAEIEALADNAKYPQHPYSVVNGM